MRYLSPFALLIFLQLSAQDKFEQAKTFFRSEPNKSISLLEEYVLEDLSSADLAKGYYALSYLYHYQEGPLDKALICAFRALSQFDKISDKEGEEKTLRHISQIHLKAGNYSESKEYSLLALKYDVGENKTSQNNHNLGIANKSLGNYLEAIENYSKCILYYETQNDQDKVCELIIELGLIEFYREHYVEAIGQYDKAYGKAREWKLIEWQSKALNNTGNAYLMLNEPDKAIDFLRKSVKLDFPNSDRVKVAAAHNIAKIFFERRKLDSAQHYIMIAINAYANLNDLPQYFDALDLRKQIAIARMDIDSAMFYLNSQSELAKELLEFRGDLQRQNTQLLVSWKETQKRNLDLSNRNRMIREQRDWLIGGGVLFILVILGLLFKLRSKKATT